MVEQPHFSHQYDNSNNIFEELYVYSALLCYLMKNYLNYLKLSKRDFKVEILVTDYEANFPFCCDFRSDLYSK